MKTNPLRKTLGGSRVLSTVLIAAVALMTARTALALSWRAWTGGASADGRWDRTANWDNGNVSTVNDIANFNNKFTGNKQPVFNNDMSGNGFAGRLNVAGDCTKSVTFNIWASKIFNLNTAGITMQNANQDLTIGGNGMFRQRDDNAEGADDPNVTWSVGTGSGTGDLTISAATFDIDAGVTLTTDVGLNRTVDIQSATPNKNVQIIKSGAGLLILGANNEHTGGTVLNAGTIEMGNAGALVKGTSTFRINGGTLDMKGYNQNADGGIIFDGGVVEDTSASGGSKLRTTGTFDFQNGGSVVSVTLVDNGTPAVLAKTDGGTATVSGDNLFSGGVNMQNGTLILGHNNALGTANVLTMVKDGSTDTLQLNGFSPTLVGLTDDGGTGTENSIIENGGSGTATLTINVTVGGPYTYSDILQDGTSGTLALTKTGAGTQIIAADTTYTGTTRVEGGILLLDHGSACNDSPMVVDGGTLQTGTSVAWTSPNALDLQGSGSIACGTGSTLTFADSSGVAWGAGTLAVTGVFGVDGSGISQITFGSDDTALTSDQLDQITVNGEPAELGSGGQLYVRVIPGTIFLMR